MVVQDLFGIENDLVAKEQTDQAEREQQHQKDAQIKIDRPGENGGELDCKPDVA